MQAIRTALPSEHQSPTVTGRCEPVVGNATVKPFSLSIDDSNSQFKYMFTLKGKEDKYCSMGRSSTPSPLSWLSASVGWGYSLHLRDLQGVFLTVDSNEVSESRKRGAMPQRDVSLTYVCDERSVDEPPRGWSEDMGAGVVPAFEVIMEPGSFCYHSANWLGAHYRMPKGNSSKAAGWALQTRKTMKRATHVYKSGTFVAFQLLVWLPDVLRNRSMQALPHRVMAEGQYNPSTGQLCMMGCRKLWDPQVQLDYSVLAQGVAANSQQEHGLEDGEHDCKVRVTLQLPRQYPWPLINMRQPLSGQVESLRDLDDLLYFPPVTFRQPGFMTADEQEAASERREAKLLGGVLVSSAMILCSLSQSTLIKNEPHRSHQTSLLGVGSLILGLALTILSGILEDAFRGYAGLPFWRSNWSNITSVHSSVLAIVAGDIFVLGRLLWQLHVARRRSPSPHWSASRDEESLEMALVRDGEAAEAELPAEGGPPPPPGEAGVHEASRKGLWTAQRSHLLLVPLYLVMAGYSVASIWSPYPTIMYSRRVHVFAAMGSASADSADTFGVFARVVYVTSTSMGIFGGLLQDTFLLPQLVLNVSSGITWSPLHPAYSYGLTGLRAAAHLYEPFSRNVGVVLVLIVGLYQYLFSDFIASPLANRLR